MARSGGSKSVSSALAQPKTHGTSASSGCGGLEGAGQSESAGKKTPTMSRASANFLVVRGKLRLQ